MAKRVGSTSGRAAPLLDGEDSAEVAPPAPDQEDAGRGTPMESEERRMDGEPIAKRTRRSEAAAGVRASGPLALDGSGLSSALQLLAASTTADPATSPSLSTPEEGSEPVASLPRELLSHVFGLLDVAERSRASRVCRRWRAAALDPPHSTRLSFRLRHEWELVEDLDPRANAATEWPAAAWAPDPTALTEAEMRLALGSPLACSFKTLSVTLGRAAAAPDFGPVDAGHTIERRWPISALLGQLPSSSMRLEFILSEDSRPGNQFYRQLASLQMFAPQLRELALVDFPFILLVPGMVPEHEGIELLDAKVDPFIILQNLQHKPLEALAGLPSLRRISWLKLCTWGLESLDLQPLLDVLVKRGIRVRSLRLGSDVNLSSKDVLEAVSAIFEPKAAGFEGCSGPATFVLEEAASYRVPESGLPESFAADAELIRCSRTCREMLSWLTAVSRRPSLKVLELKQIAISPLPLLEGLQGCREGLLVKLEWPELKWDDARDKWRWRGDWDFQGLRNACEFLLEDGALLRAVSISLNWVSFASESFLAVEALPAVDAVLEALSLYYTERFDALAERRPLSGEEAGELQHFLEFVRGRKERAKAKLKAVLARHKAVLAKLAKFRALERRALACLPEPESP